MIVDPSTDDAANVRTMLCMPIVNANKDVIGVAQLINKVNFILFYEILYQINIRLVRAMSVTITLNQCTSHPEKKTIDKVKKL